MELRSGTQKRLFEKFVREFCRLSDNEPMSAAVKILRARAQANPGKDDAA